MGRYHNRCVAIAEYTGFHSDSQKAKKSLLQEPGIVHAANDNSSLSAPVVECLGPAQSL
jgi:hypothetical protein